MKAIVLLNAAAGTMQNGGAGRDSISEALAAAGIDAEIQMIAAGGLPEAALAAAKSGVDVVIAGGGDGTLSTVAAVLAGTSMPLGILPLGTLNHFAKDLQIPLDLAGAVAVIAAHRVKSIDVGDVNGHTFVNNSSLGVYPHMVLDREAQRKHRRIKKWWAMILAILKTFRRFPLVHVQLTTGDTTIVRKTPLVFVGNNCYQLDLFRIGTRDCLDRGELSLYVANAATRWSMLKLTWRALFGGLQQARDFEMFRLTNCLIETNRSSIHVAIDGEVLKLKPPLQFQTRAGALRVCAPSGLAVGAATDSVDHVKT